MGRPTTWAGGALRSSSAVGDNHQDVDPGCSPACAAARSSTTCRTRNAATAFQLRGSAGYSRGCYGRLPARVFSRLRSSPTSGGGTEDLATEVSKLARSAV